MKPKLLDLVRNKIRLRHYSIRTEKTYLDWIRRFILFHNKKHPKDMGAAEEVLGIELPWLNNVRRAKKTERLPVVFSRKEIKAVMANLDGVHWIMGQLLYGAGLRLMECVRLRVKDIDFDYRQITVRDGKGKKDRVTMLPKMIEVPLHQHLEKARIIHEQDLKEGYGEVYLPFGLERKYRQANKEWGWQYVFPVKKRSLDPRSEGTTSMENLFSVP
ncbi:MAG: tyrosine-type recombinase/integrase [Deltaproteobacteria bacterium]|nr:tyrosine-type recombinase/integrase [Deltaproteobacteria bacterium]MBW2154450.1 tyrosine-type recombinase/integrase [Deltaproteobacteria bacterium]